MPKAAKAIKEYVDPAPNWWESRVEDYQLRPAVTFLRETVHIADAINLCRRSFTRKKDGGLNKDGQDSMYRLGAAAFSSIMSHFEMYQRSLFAGLFEATRFHPQFTLASCVKYLEKDANFSLDMNRLFAYRGRTAPVGHLVADMLGSWHSPTKVNDHFRSLVHDRVLFANDDVVQLVVLWQIRHSVVHTGGWLTHADAQKTPVIASLADKPLLPNENFVEAVARRLHGIVYRATTGVGTAFLPKLSAATTPIERARMVALFAATSPRPAWLLTAA